MSKRHTVGPYRGYCGTIEETNGVQHGRLLGTGDDMITYEIDRYPSAIEALRAAVDDYLDWIANSEAGV